MRKLSFTLSFLLWVTVLFGQSPHGKSFEIDCSYCHTTTGWKVDLKAITFDHDSTSFKLVGQHQTVNCRSCHKSLEFSTAKSECIDCHNDLHENTLGPDCARCHTPKSWIIENISEIHQRSRFPLTGAHQMGDCTACHKSGSMRRFDPLGIECIDCHQSNYLATTKPNHQQAGYSTDCIQCHKAGSAGWVASNIEHSFFPLTGGHDISCTQCHTDGTYSKITTDCFACHQGDFNATKTPDHRLIDLSTHCQDCHTTNPSWKPARFIDHDARFFPVYSGKHADVWNNCTDCHKQSGNYAVFACIDCHAHSKASMDDSHKETNGYQYNSVACFTCHPRGDKEGGFNHAATNFPLTGAHTTTDCTKCHNKGFGGTATDCNSCHKAKYDNAQAPAHATAGLPTECEPCHNTTAWAPSTFNHLTTGYELIGGHRKVTQCADCHKGTVTGTKQECITCHQTQYDNAQNHKQSGYPLECQACHTQETWQGASFDHALTKFPLTGSHAGVDCVKCHSGGYIGTSTECNSCHAPAFNSAQNPNHVAAGIPVLCETCHNTTSWKPSSFNHITTGFALTGGHSRVGQCSECHKGTVLNTRADCIACHQAQYDNAKDHKALAYPVDCKFCHNADNWDNASFNHSLTGFPLTGAHTATLCAKCHANGYTGTPTECNACHATSFSAAQNPNHTAAGIPTVCEPCHNTTAWKPSTFNHGTTGFALTGGHSRVAQCSECHKGTVLNTRADCIACHQAQYDNAKDHKAQAYPTDCKLCHNSDSWDNAAFNHSLTGFPLTGAHTATLCVKCHTNGYAGTPTDCNACHSTSYNASQTPNHTAAGIPKVCEPCHNTTAWKPSVFNHTTTGFALTGGHSAIAQCSDCHKGTLTNTRSDCLACHQAQYDAAKDHKAQSYPADCKMCHNANNWLNASFNHSQTSFPLTGAHTSVACSQCHTSGFSNTPTACNSCHSGSFSAAQNPNHAAAGIPRACETCHTTTAWKPSSFNHSSTGFSLTGGHATVAQCSQCHIGTLLSANPQCLSCHQAQYDSAKDHKAQSYPTDCKLCHNANDWLNATFNHSQTAFPLTGAHTSVACSQCHTSGFSNTPTACNACHSSSFSAAQNPNHAAAGIPRACETCHSTTAWKPSSFNHSSTGFSLTGGHATVAQCSQCHIGTLLSASPQCLSCHQSQYDSAKDHKAQSYPTDCKLCHNSDNWLNASFNHSQTAFPLTGAHTSVLCAQCHTSGYANTPTACSACHTTDYNLAANPSHKTLGLSMTCTDCHSTNPGWTPATFSVHNNYYVLSGAHAAISTNCALCHKGNYSTTPTTCYGCHQANYTATTNPNHSAAQFPTDCESCHNVTAWKPSTWNHDSQYFPIYSGKHQGRWSSCTDCHTNSSNYSAFSCIDCHEHNKTSMDEKHQGRTGYAYNSAACYSCHPRGDS